MRNYINAAIQVLPTSETRNTYDIIDDAISIIKKSGLKHKVCPFETVVEGFYNEVISLIREVQEECFKKGADEILVNIKIQNKKNGKVTIDEKMKKYV